MADDGEGGGPFDEDVEGTPLSLPPPTGSHLDAGGDGHPPSRETPSSTEGHPNPPGPSSPASRSGRPRLSRPATPRGRRERIVLPAVPPDLAARLDEEP